MICLICGTEFTPKRSDAKFCSEACKQKNKRNSIMPGEEEVPVVAETAEPQKNISVTSTQHNTRWDKVCTEEEWKKYPNMCDTKARKAALTELYDRFTAEELANAGVRPPQWKKTFSTYAEAKASLEETMRELGLEPSIQGYWNTPNKHVKEGKEDYSTWK